MVHDHALFFYLKSSFSLLFGRYFDALDPDLKSVFLIRIRRSHFNTDSHGSGSETLISGQFKFKFIPYGTTLLVVDYAGGRFLIFLFRKVTGARR